MALTMVGRRSASHCACSLRICSGKDRSVHGRFLCLKGPEALNFASTSRLDGACKDWPEIKGDSSSFLLANDWWNASRWLDFQSSRTGKPG